MNTPDTPDNIRAEEARQLKALFNQRKRERPGLNQEVLAEACGWSSQGTVSQYMSGRLELNLEALMRFARALDFDPAQVSPRLAKKVYDPAPTTTQPQFFAEAGALWGDNVHTPTDPGRLLPVIGLVQAGAFCEAVDNFHPGDADEWMHSGGPVGHRAFVLRVEGISMQPDLQPGDLVVIDPDLSSHPGDIVLAKRASDQGVTLKRLRKEGGEFFLEASNPSWPERIIRLTEEWHICGKARRKIVEL